MEGIKYLNLIEIGPVVIEIRGAENGELAVPVNNILASHTTFLAADTRPCVLIYCTGFKRLANHAHTYNYSIVTTKLQKQQQVWTSWTIIQWVTMYMQLMIL